MARTGPNQDVNDFGSSVFALTGETIMEIANWYQLVDNSHSLFVAQSAAKDIFATGPSLINLAVPLRMSDGSTELLFGGGLAGSDFKGPGIIPSSRLIELVPNATIATYVNLPEIFRGYWEVLNASIALMNSYTVVDEEAETITTQIFLKPPGTPKPTPEWEGEGPANYNTRTWPQLLDEVRLILVTDVIDVVDTSEE